MQLLGVPTSELNFFHGHVYVCEFNTQMFWQTCDLDKSVQVQQKVRERELELTLAALAHL